MRLNTLTLAAVSLIASGCAQGLNALSAATPEPTATEFICPVTPPNEKAPPGEQPPYTNIYGNDEGTMWTAMWPDGRIIFSPGGPGSIEKDGKLGMKTPWWRLPKGGKLTITGRRLDGEAPPASGDVPDGYGGAFQATGVYYPTPGCWEITGTVGDSTLTYVTEIVVECPDDPDIYTGLWQSWSIHCPAESGQG